MRRPITLVSAAALTVTTSVVATLAATSGQKALDKPRPKGPPVSVRSVVLQSNVDIKGDSFVFHRPVELSADQLHELSGAPDTGAWIRPRGGVDADMVIAQIVLAGNRAEPVRVLNMTAVPRCSDPLTGTLVYSPRAGADDSVLVAFNLDERNPQARTWTMPTDGTSSRFGAAYFGAKTVSLKYREQQTFQVLGTTRHGYCEFRIRLSVLVGGKTETLMMGNGAQPFKVSALTKSTKTGPGFADYRRLYIGGVENWQGHGEFARVDPGTYRSGHGSPQ